MNRWFNQFFFSLEKKKIVLFGKVAIGASGAPTLNVAASKGIASIAKNSTGNYTITLQDQYVDLFNAKCVILKSSGSPLVIGHVIRSQDVVGAKTIIVEFLNASFAATDPASGCELELEIVLKGSTV